MWWYSMPKQLVFSLAYYELIQSWKLVDDNPRKDMALMWEMNINLLKIKLKRKQMVKDT